MKDMTNMPETYTYTARSLRNPNKVITLTLVDHHLRVDIPELLDTIGDVTQAEERMTEAGERIKTQIQPTAMKLAETLSGPIHLSDVSADLEGDQLTVMAWKRVGGLRLAPLSLKVRQVDNPAAAEDFMEELDERKSTASHKGKFIGPLDYWIGWIGMLMGVFLLLRWPGRRST